VQSFAWNLIMIKTIVEFFVLWLDYTWTIEQVELNGNYTREKTEELGREKLDILFKDSKTVMVVGPVYSIRVMDLSGVEVLDNISRINQEKSKPISA
jgi:hypothetical protein